jgi:hypothetical protein
MKNEVLVKERYAIVCIGRNNDGSGKFTRVDNSIVERLEELQFSWRQSSNGYACATVNSEEYGYNTTLMMHTMLGVLYGMVAEQAHVIDHINGDKLDNTSANLRYVSRAENAFNVDDKMVHIDDTRIGFLKLYAIKIGMPGLELCLTNSKLINAKGFFYIRDARKLFMHYRDAAKAQFKLVV